MFDCVEAVCQIDWVCRVKALKLSANAVLGLNVRCGIYVAFIGNRTSSVHTHIHTYLVVDHSEFLMSVARHPFRRSEAAIISG